MTLVQVLWRLSILGAMASLADIAPTFADTPVIGAPPTMDRNDILQIQISILDNFIESSNVSRNGFYIKNWRLQAVKNQRLRIEMKSDDFDTFLKFLSPSGDVLVHDNDGGALFNSKLQIVIPETGEYTVQATQSEKKKGEYAIFSEEVKPRIYSEDGDPNEKYALVVGIADYPSVPYYVGGEEALAFKNLPFVIKDIATIEELLISQGVNRENIEVLRNEDATRENILNGITQFLGQAKAGGTAIFYFSGHGTRLGFDVPDFEGNLDEAKEDNRDEAIVSYDSIIIDDELGRALDSLQSEKQLVILDSCHSGTGAREGEQGITAKGVDFFWIRKFISLPQKQMFHSIIQDSPRVRISMFASTESESAYGLNGKPIESSLFTYQLNRTLAKASELTFEQYFSNLSDIVQDYAFEKLFKAQTPKIELQYKSDARITIGEFFD